MTSAQIVDEIRKKMSSDVVGVPIQAYIIPSIDAHQVCSLPISILRLLCQINEFYLIFSVVNVCLLCRMNLYLFMIIGFDTFLDSLVLLRRLLL